MSKFMYVVEYIRQSYVTNHRDGTHTLDYFASDAGKLLKKTIKNAGLDYKDFDIRYGYPRIPDPKPGGVNSKGQVLSYKDPSAKEVKEFIEEIKHDIVVGDYEMIIPTGKIGLHLSNSKTRTISKRRGIPEKVEITSPKTGETREVWLLATYGLEYVMAQVNNLSYVQKDFEKIKQFDTQGDELFQPKKVDYELVLNMTRVREVFKFLDENKPVTAWDLETNTLRPEMLGSKALILTLAWEEGKGLTIPLDKDESPFSKEEVDEIMQMMKRFVADKKLIKVGANIKYDIRFLMSAYGFKYFEKNVDIQIAYYLTINQNAKEGLNLSKLAHELTDMGGYDDPLDDYKKNYIAEYKKEHGEKPINEIDGSNFNYEWIPLEVLHPYGAGDVDATIRIYNKLVVNINKREEWQKLFFNWYPMLSVALARTEGNGLSVDMDYIEVLKEEYTKETERLIEELRKFPSVKQLEAEHSALYEAGLEEMRKPVKERDKEVAKLRNKYKTKLKFNPNSANDKGRLLYDILNVKLPVQKDYAKPEALSERLTPDEMPYNYYKTDKHALGEIKRGGYGEEAKQVALILLQHSKVSTLNTNFTQKYPQFISNGDNKMHGILNITGTETSRLSARDPNFQQLPSSHQDTHKFDYKFPIKRMFKSEFENGAILNADYSSLEVRVLGLATKDEVMIKSFFDGEDAHKETASIIYNKPIEDVTKDERQSAKAITFGD